MTRITTLIAVLAAGAGLALPAGADDEHHQAATTAQAPAAAKTAWSEGEVRKIDKGAGKVTIKHGWIHDLDMPPMTMAYGVKDKSVLDTLKPGDKIKFEVEHAGKEYTVLHLEKGK